VRVPSVRSARSVLVGTAAATLLASLPFALAAPADAAPKQRTGYQEYVALGDSWSADVVVADTDGPPDSTYAPMGCAQSHRNYPKLLAAELQVPVFRDATCGSATTDDFYAPQTGLPTGETNPAQFDRLSPTTDLVTVGVGGNDAGFAGAAMDCLSPLPQGAQCKEKYTAGGVDQLAQAIEESEPKLVRALQEIHRRSPRARVLMLDYLAGIPEHGCYPVVPVSDSDMQYLYATFQKLNAMVQRAAAEGGAEFVNTYDASLGHHVCSDPTYRYVEGLGIVSVNGVAVAVPAHPNSAGAASQYRSTLAVVRG
jgi:lysophospholipase L1-like esterase